MVADAFDHADARLPTLRGRTLAEERTHAARAQRALCLDCRRTFTLSPKGPRYDQPFKAQVVAAYQDRMSTRGIRRTFGVCYQTLMVWVGKKVAALPALEDTLLPGQAGDVLELDELWSFVPAIFGAAIVRGFPFA